MLLAPNFAVNAKWGDWKISHVGSNKLNLDKLAILALADNNRNWKGMECLQIYPIIGYKITDPKNYWVKYPNDDVILFKLD